MRFVSVDPIWRALQLSIVLPLLSGTSPRGCIDRGSLHQIDGFFARASARPVRHRTETRIKPLDALDLAKEAFLAFFSLWGKKFDR